MKGRKPEDLRNLADEELSRSLLDAEETFANLQFQHALGELQNTAYLSTMRKDIARIKTIIRQRDVSRERETSMK